MNTCTPTTCPPDQETVLKPRYSVNAGKEVYEVRVEIPGARKETVHVNLDEGVLTIQAQRQPVARDGWKTLHRELSDLGYACLLYTSPSPRD